MSFRTNRPGVIFELENASNAGGGDAVTAVFSTAQLDGGSAATNALQLNAATDTGINADANNVNVALGGSNLLTVSTAVGDATLQIAGTGAIDLPVGNSTTERPVNANAGYFRFNSTDTVLEYHDGAQWVSVASGAAVDNTAIFDGASSAASTTKIETDSTVGEITADSVNNTVFNVGGNFDVNATSAIQLDAAAASNFTVDSANLTLETTTSGNLAIQSAGIVDIDGSGITVNSTSTYAVTAAGATFTMTGSNDVDFVIPSGQTIKVDNASQYDSDMVAASLTTKQYVDSVAAGLDPKASVDYATTGTEADLVTAGWIAAGAGAGKTLTAPAAGTTTFDGTVLSDGDRVLVKNENGANRIHNGIYDVSNAGAGSATVLTRATDFDDSPANEVDGGEHTFVTGGSTLANTGWVQQNDVTSIDTAGQFIEFAQFSAAGLISVSAGNGIVVNQTGNDYAVSINTGTSVLNAGVGTLTLPSGGNAAGIPLIAQGGTAEAVFGAVDLANSSAVTGQLPVANGGTGLSTIADASILRTASADTVSALTVTPDGNDKVMIYDDTAGDFSFIDRSSVGVTDVFVTFQTDSGAGDAFTAVGSDTFSVLGGDGVSVTNTGGVDTITAALDFTATGLTASAPSAATDLMAVYNGTGYVASTIQQVIDTSTAITDADFVTNGLMVRTAAGTYTNVSLAVDGAGNLDGLAVANADGTSGNPTFGLDITGNAAASENLAATDEIIVYNASATANQKMTGQEIADGVAALISNDNTRIQDAANTTFVDTDAVANTVTIEALPSGVGGVDMNAGTAGVIVDTSGAVSLDAAAASNFTVVGANLTLATTTSGNVAVSSAATFDVDATAIDMDATSASAMTVTGAGLTLETVTSGDVTVASAGALDMDGASFTLDATGTGAVTAAGVTVTTTGSNDVDFVIPSGQTVKVDNATQYNNDMVAASLTTKQYVDGLISGGANIRGVVGDADGVAQGDALGGYTDTLQNGDMFRVQGSGAGNTGTTNFLATNGLSNVDLDTGDFIMFTNSQFYLIDNNDPVVSGPGLIESTYTSATETFAITLESSATANQVLLSSGSAGGALGDEPTYGALPLGDANAVSGQLETANGGTGSDLSSLSDGQVVYSNGTDLVGTAVGNSGEVLVSNGGGAPTFQSVSTAVDAYSTVTDGITPLVASGASTLTLSTGTQGGLTVVTSATPDTVTFDLDIAGRTPETALEDTDLFMVYNGATNESVSWQTVRNQLELDQSLFQIVDSDGGTFVRVAADTDTATLDKVEFHTDSGANGTAVFFMEVAPSLASDIAVMNITNNTNTNSGNEVTIEVGDTQGDYGANSTANVDLRLVPGADGEVIIGSSGAARIQADTEQDITIAGGDSVAGQAGNVILTGGDSTSGTDGQVQITTVANQNPLVTFDTATEATNDGFLTISQYNVAGQSGVDIAPNNSDNDNDLATIRFSFPSDVGDAGGTVRVDNATTYDANMVAESLVTKNYVDSQVAGQNTSLTVVNETTTSRTAVAFEVIRCTNTGNTTVTLPASSSNGDTVYVKRDNGVVGSAGDVTVSGGAATVDGAASHLITVDKEAIKVVSDGTNWFIV